MLIIFVFKYFVDYLSNLKNKKITSKFFIEKYIMVDVDY